MLLRLLLPRFNLTNLSHVLPIKQWRIAVFDSCQLHLLHLVVFYCARGKRKSNDVTASGNLLESYVAVCNDVISANRDRFPYGQIWEAAEQSLFGRCFRFEITGGETNRFCPCTFHEGRIYPIQSESACMTVRFSEDYVRSVVEHPEKFIDNPTLINWDWLQHSPEKECRCSLMKVVAGKFAGTGRAGIVR